MSANDLQPQTTWRDVWDTAKVILASGGIGLTSGFMGSGLGLVVGTLGGSAFLAGAIPAVVSGAGAFLLLQHLKNKDKKLRAAFKENAETSAKRAIDWGFFGGLLYISGSVVGALVINLGLAAPSPIATTQMQSFNAPSVKPTVQIVHQAPPAFKFPPHITSG